jgi:hypothetical protein
VRAKNWAILNFPAVMESWNNASDATRERWHATGHRPLHMGGPGKFLVGEGSWTTNLKIISLLRELSNDGVPAAKWITPSTPGFGKTPIWDRLFNKENIHVSPTQPDNKKRLYHPARLEVGTNTIVNAERTFVTPKGNALRYISVNNRLRCADIKALPYNPKRDDHVVGYYRVSMPKLMSIIAEQTWFEDIEADKEGNNSLAGAIESCLYDRLCDEIVMIDCEAPHIAKRSMPMSLENTSNPRAAWSSVFRW